MEGEFVYGFCLAPSEGIRYKKAKIFLTQHSLIRITAHKADGGLDRSKDGRRYWL